jgi:hypothetical protein
MISAAMKKAGFEPAPTVMRRRMLAATDGLAKTGKTEFGLSMPEPVAVFNFDEGLEGVVEKWARRKEIIVKSYRMPAVAKQSTYLDMYKRYMEDYQAVLEEKGIQSILGDTASDIWELFRMAEFGQLSPAADIKRAYVMINQVYRNMIRQAYDSGKNVVWTHRVKDEYRRIAIGDGKTKEERTGNHIRSGFGESTYMIQANVRHYFNKGTGQFEMEILDSRHDMALSGMKFTRSEECNFTTLAMAVFDDTTEEDWR